MEKKFLEKILEDYKDGHSDIHSAIEAIKTSSIHDLGFARIDNHREGRTGYPEVIFCEGKTDEQVREIINSMLDKDVNILGTRATPEMYKEVKNICSKAEYNKLARTITIKQTEKPQSEHYISIVTAGTSDIPVAEEAAITAEIFGNRTMRVFDVGVAGIHRLFDRLDDIKGGRAIVVVAGMEGALPSIVGGLVDKPVIAVPTSVGYGAAMNGMAALMGMLTSCASGISVVNIDNGFGAGYFASMINNL
jgi:hypothetical protein